MSSGRKLKKILKGEVLKKEVMLWREIIWQELIWRKDLDKYKEEIKKGENKESCNNRMTVTENVILD
jgi:hypothetical protein